MLTEIEWWGGVLFLWFAGCYWLTQKEYDPETKLSVDYLAFNIAFLSSAAVLALYFYTLESEVYQQLYIATLGVGLLSTLLMLFWPESKSANEEEKVQSEKKTDEAAEEEEEVGPIFEFFGQLIFLFPVLVSLALGLYKSVDYIEAVGLLS